MSSVLEPHRPKEMDRPQLLLQKEVLDFDIFPLSEHASANIATWLKAVLVHNNITFDMITGLTPDGAADGQAALNSIPQLGEKTDT